MKVYELMNQLGQMKADQDVRIGVCLTYSELTSGEQIAKDAKTPKEYEKRVKALAKKLKI